MEQPDSPHYTVAQIANSSMGDFKESHKAQQIGHLLPIPKVLKVSKITFDEIRYRLQTEWNLHFTGDIIEFGNVLLECEGA